MAVLGPCGPVYLSAFPPSVFRKPYSCTCHTDTLAEEWGLRRCTKTRVLSPLTVQHHPERAVGMAKARRENNVQVKRIGERQIEKVGE